MFWSKEPKKVALPMGMQEFKEFADAIYEGAQVPGLTKDSAYEVIASMILHKPSTESFVTLEFFVHALRKQAANNVAYAIVEELEEKRKQARQAKLAEAKAEAEAKALEEARLLVAAPATVIIPAPQPASPQQASNQYVGSSIISTSQMQQAQQAPADSTVQVRSQDLSRGRGN